MANPSGDFATIENHFSNRETRSTGLQSHFPHLDAHSWQPQSHALGMKKRFLDPKPHFPYLETHCADLINRSQIDARRYPLVR